MRPDIERAEAYALSRLTLELPSTFCYHSVAHTRDDVLPAAQRLAAQEGLSQEDWLLLKTAALYHDTGFLTQPQRHEEASIAIAREVLPTFGYAPAQVETVAYLIRATILPQTATTPLAQILADADLDVLGRADYFEKSALLRREREALGEIVGEREWQLGQLAFLQQHTYFTAAARRLSEPGKQANLARLELLLETGLGTC